MLSIDTMTVLQPIEDSTISEDDVIAKEESTEIMIAKKRKKVKPTKLIKICNGFMDLFSLYTSNNTIHEKQMKKDCRRLIRELISSNCNNSKELAMIRDFEVMEDWRLCEMTIQIFCDSDRAETVDDCLCFNVWNIGLLMLCMLIGKERVMRCEQRLNNVNGIRSLLTDLYLQHKISTNCFDLLYFYMLIFQDAKQVRKMSSRYDQIEHHLWFHKL